MLEDVARTPLRADLGQGPAAPVLCPGDRVVADVRLTLLGIRLPFAVLGDTESGSPPPPGRVRLPATPDEIGRALLAGELVVGDCESTPIAVLTDLAISSPDAGWVEGRLLTVDAEPSPGSGASASDGGAVLPTRTGETRVVVIPGRPLTDPDLEHLRELPADEVVLVLPDAGPTPDGLPATVLRQCLIEVAPAEFTLLALPVSWRGTSADKPLARAVAAGLDGTHLWRPRPATETRTEPAEAARTEAGDVLWVDTLHQLRTATTLPATSTDKATAAVLPVLTDWRPPRSRRGLVVLFTGLSGSGKSTLAKALADQLTLSGDRKVTLLDGDVVRRMLSSGLGFDRAGRDLNVRRIGFVAAEVARHGGIAVCAPIAPYAESRAAVRAMVEEVGDLVLVHVATPLAECERRDVKGLYRKARAGVLTQFTGISDPYDEPVDAEIRVDTSNGSPDDSLAVIAEYLTRGGWIGGPESTADVTGPVGRG